MTLKLDKIDVAGVMDRLGVKYERRGVDLYARCRSGEHPDRKPSWHVAWEGEHRGVFNCWSCHWSGTILDYIQKVRGCSTTEAEAFAAGSASERPTRESDRSVCMATFARRSPREIQPPDGLWPVEEGGDCHRYLAGRGFGSRIVERYWLKDWRMCKRVFVPTTRDGALVSYDARSYAGAEPKVLTPEGHGIEARWGLFGIDLADRGLGYVNLTEGWASAIRLHQAGLKNEVASRGSRLTAEKVEELAWAEEVVLWREGDKAGEMFERDCRAWLSCRLVVVDLPTGKDPADFTPEEIRAIHRRKR